jgi:hypothetical protein
MSRTSLVINSWAELASVIGECAAGIWIFRGESDTSFVLKPKAGRVGAYGGAARKRAYDPIHERAALDLLKRQARPYLAHTPSTDLEWLAIAQHHGMSTRLLDWTESMLVAAYFATATAGVNGDAVIYGIQGLRKLSAEEEAKPFESTSTGVYLPPHITPRIPAQRGVFTLHPDPTATFDSPQLTRWVIRKNACGLIKQILNACAINESSLFPDMDGLSRHIGWRYKWGSFDPSDT